MLTRTVLLVAALFAMSGSFAQAKVSPTLEMQQQINVQQLRQVLDGFTEHGLCDLEGHTVSEPIDEMAAQSPFDINSGNDTCLVPAPEPDIFQNIAHAA